MYTSSYPSGKKHTYVKIVGQNSGFLFGIYWWPLRTINLDDMIYSSWYIECGRLKLVIIGNFLSFTPSFPNPPQKNLKNQNFEKMKKSNNNNYYYNRIHLCIRNQNHNHTSYSSWDTGWDRQNFLWFWAIFALLPPYWLQQ